MVPTNTERRDMKLAIFDLDDTLINFAATRQVAYRELAEVVDREGIDPVAYIQGCTVVDRPLFMQFEQGKLTRAEYRLQRFRDPFTNMGLSARDELVALLNKTFMDCVNDRPMLYDDVMPVLQRLRVLGIRTAILTNGPSDGQRRKLKATALFQAVDEVAIGEEIGFSKPSPMAFKAVLDRFSFSGKDTLMVGDSPELDYDAALNAGLSALLLDRDDRHRESGRAAIRSLDAVLAHAADQRASPSSVAEKE
jgi:putative hydrolase of the HAD superfamily